MVAAIECVVSKQDIRAMKQADRVCFDHRHADGGVGQIRCIKVIRNPGPFDDRDKTYTIPCESRVVAYSLGDDGLEHVSDRVTCFEMFHSTGADYYPWTAVCALVREGDTLRLKWVADSCNGYMKEANKTSAQVIHHDTLTLQIVRDGSVIYSLPLASGHCPNNSARMIRGL